MNVEVTPLVDFIFFREQVVQQRIIGVGLKLEVRRHFTKKHRVGE